MVEGSYGHALGKEALEWEGSSCNQPPSMGQVWAIRGKGNCFGKGSERIRLLWGEEGLGHYEGGGNEKLGVREW